MSQIEPLPEQEVLRSTCIEISRRLIDRSSALAVAARDQYYQDYPQARGMDDPHWRKKTIQDLEYHITFLAEAIASQRPALFVSYMAWVRDTLHGLGLLDMEISNSLKALGKTLVQALPAHQEILNEYLDQGLEKLAAEPPEVPATFLDVETAAGRLASQYLQLLLSNNHRRAADLILKEYSTHNNLKEIYLKVLQPAQYEIGRLWQLNRVSVAQEHFCTATTQIIMAQFYPYLFSLPRNGRVLVAACVGSELHEIGMRMIADLFEMEGWDTYYLGANTPAASVVQAVVDRQAHVLGISTTMTFHLGQVRQLVGMVRSHPECQSVKILVGGYPFNQAPDLWREIGADGYGQNAEAAIAAANRFIEAKPAWNPIN